MTAALDIHGLPGHLIRRLNQISVAQFHEAMADLGLDLTPVQFAVLSAVASKPGIDQATVSGLVAHDRATVGKVIERLADKGCLLREVSENDRRSKVLKLTGSGLGLLETARPAVEALQPSILSGLDSREQALFLELLDKAANGGNNLSRAPLRAVSE
jgi:DNA-binding MarR family transcriptional regulator